MLRRRGSIRHRWKQFSHNLGHAHHRVWLVYHCQLRGPDLPVRVRHRQRIAYLHRHDRDDTWPGFTFLSADVMLGTFVQYQVQSSAGAITPAVTVSGATTDAFNTVSLALKGGAQGSAPPPGIRIFGVHHVDYYHAGSIMVPSKGNLLYVTTAFGTRNVNITSISSKPGTLGWNFPTQELPTALRNVFMHLTRRLPRIYLSP